MFCQGPRSWICPNTDCSWGTTCMPQRSLASELKPTELNSSDQSNADFTARFPATTFDPERDLAVCCELRTNRDIFCSSKESKSSENFSYSMPSIFNENREPKGAQPLTSTSCGHHSDCVDDTAVNAVSHEMSQLILPLSKLFFLRRETPVLRSSSN